MKASTAHQPHLSTLTSPSNIIFIARLPRNLILSFGFLQQVNKSTGFLNLLSLILSIAKFSGAAMSKQRGGGMSQTSANEVTYSPPTRFLLTSKKQDISQIQNLDAMTLCWEIKLTYHRNRSFEDDSDDIFFWL